MRSVDQVDRITQGTLKELVGRPGPWVTITMATHRTGADVRQDPIRFKNLAAEGADLLAGIGGPDAAETAAAALEELRADHEFWRRQADGLVVLASGDGVRTHRVAQPLPENVRVADWPGLRELSLALDPDDHWYIVAVSQNSLRLFAATGADVTELPLEEIPASSDDAVGDIERQQHLQWSPQGDGNAKFHGHGGGREIDRVWLEKYLRQVVAGLEAHSARPGTATVVLVGVPELVASLRSIWGSRAILPNSVAGNPDQLSPADLHDAAFPLVRAAREQEGAELLENLGSSARGIHDESEILRAAAEGRLAELYLGEAAGDSADAAIKDTLVFGGTIRPLPGLQAPMAALARY